MCLIRVKPGADDEVAVPSRILTERRSSVHPTGGVRSRVSVIETVQVPPPPPSAGGGRGGVIRETQIVQHRTPSSYSHRRDDHHYGRSSRASIVSTQSRERDYYIDGSAAVAARSPRSSYRYVDGRTSAQRLEGMDADGERSRGDRYGYNNYHGRKSGSISYVNPRNSHRSVRSQGGGAGGRISREKVVVVDRYPENINNYH